MRTLSKRPLNISVHFFYLLKIDAAPIDSRGQMGRARIAENLRHCKFLYILRQKRAAHDSAVQLYIFGNFPIAGLYEFLGNSPYSLPIPDSRDITCRITFSDSGTCTAYKIDIPFHINIV